MFNLKSTRDFFIKNKFIFTIAFLSIVGIISYFNNYNIPITVFISSLALLVSLATFFKDQIFPFRVKVIAGSIILLKPILPNGVDLIGSIMFINTSYSDGIILSVLLKVTNNKNQVKWMVPFQELSNKLVIKILKPETKTKQETTIIGDDFFPFQLKSKEGLRKNIAFVPSTTSSFTIWEPGTYNFEVYLQLEDNEKLEKYTDFEHTIDTLTVKDLIEQNHVLMSRKADYQL